MKIGAHIYLFTDRWSDDCLPFLDRARALDLDCLEIGIGDDVSFSCGLLRRRAEALGLELVISPGGKWPKECDLSSKDESERRAGLAWHKRQVDLAYDLGSRAYCGSIYGHTGVVKFRRPPAEEYQRTAEGLHLLAEYGAAKEVAIVLEPMSHFRTHLVNTPEQCMHLVAMADHENLHALLDTYHMMTEVTDFAAGIRTLGGRLWGVHACENNRGVPGSGLVPWDDVFNTLGEIGFDGYIMLESYNSSLRDFAFERGMFHNVCPDPNVFIQQGLEFLRKGLSGRSARRIKRRSCGSWNTGPKQG
jgi:D-psicose/D-tagatose/L-ribulose 3-epimerase